MFKKMPHYFQVLVLAVFFTATLPISGKAEAQTLNRIHSDCISGYLQSAALRQNLESQIQRERFQNLPSFFLTAAASIAILISTPFSAFNQNLLGKEKQGIFQAGLFAPTASALKKNLIENAPYEFYRILPFDSLHYVNAYPWSQFKKDPEQPVLGGMRFGFRFQYTGQEYANTQGAGNKYKTSFKITKRVKWIAISRDDLLIHEFQKANRKLPRNSRLEEPLITDKFVWNFLKGSIPKNGTLQKLDASLDHPRIKELIAGAVPYKNMFLPLPQEMPYLSAA